MQVLFQLLVQKDLQKIIDEAHYLVQGDSSCISLEDFEGSGLLQESRFEMNIVMKKLRAVFIKKNLIQE